jgi:hypothetical protein
MCCNNNLIWYNAMNIHPLLIEMGTECQNVVNLLNELQRPDLSVDRQGTILANLLAATIHLNVHCDEDLQDLIVNELEELPDTDES